MGIKIEVYLYPKVIWMQPAETILVVQRQERWKTDFYIKIESETFIVENYVLEPRTDLKTQTFCGSNFQDGDLVSRGSLPSLPSYFHTQGTATHGAISETDWVTPTHQANGKIPTWKEAGQAKNSHGKLHTQHSVIQSTENPQLSAVETLHKTSNMQKKRENL